ncbi:MAG: hypothetical protein ACJ8KU_05160 [Chthoniobacterales bacterium]
MPEKYDVIEHDHYREQRAFFDNPPDDPLVTEVLDKFQPDWETIRKLRNSFEVRMGEHQFLFHTQDHGEPEDLADLAESHRTGVALTDFAIGDCVGKSYGRYSEDFTWIDWWVKRANCMICFNLQGPGAPAPEIRNDVEAILQSTKWIG